MNCFFFFGSVRVLICYLGFQEALLMIANMRGDSDSVCAVAGQIAGKSHPNSHLCLDDETIPSHAPPCCPRAHTHVLTSSPPSPCFNR